MPESKISYQDARLDYQLASRCEAYTIVGADALSMLAVDDSGIVRAVVYYPFSHNDPQELSDLRAVLQSDDVFGLRFRNHFCSIFHPRATLVPTKLFDSGNLASYFKLLLLDEQIEYGYSELKEMDCVLVYAHYPVEKEICSKLSGRPVSKHLASVFLRAAQYIAPANAQGVVLNTRNKKAQVAVFDRQSLVYYNAISFENAADLVYNVMLLYDQFRLSPEQAPLLLSGNISSKDEAVHLLSNFISDVQFASAPEKLQFPDIHPPLMEHVFFELISLRHFGR
jgi:hypothetical protein